GIRVRNVTGVQTCALPISVWSYVGNSLFVAFFNVPLTVIGCAMAGYALARLRFRGKLIAIGIFVATLLIPQESSMIALTQLVNRSEERRAGKQGGKRCRAE